MAAGSASTRRTGRRSATPRPWSGSASSRSRPPGRRSGSAPTPTATSRRRASTTPAASSTATTTTGAETDREKLEEMLEFARRPCRRCGAGSKGPGLRGLVRDRVLACSVRLLDLGFFRIGGEQYAEDNGTFGLATLRKRHIRFESGARGLRLPGEGRKAPRPGGRRPEPSIKVLKALCAAQRRRPRAARLPRGPRSWRDVKSADINAYLKEAAGGDFSAKDFRTWNATVLAAVGLAPDAARPRTAKPARSAALGEPRRQGRRPLPLNTPAVCRASYIDPRVFDRFDSDATILRSGRGGDRGNRAAASSPTARRSRRPSSSSSAEAETFAPPVAGYSRADGICRALHGSSIVGSRAAPEREAHGPAPNQLETMQQEGNQHGSTTWRRAHARTRAVGGVLALPATRRCARSW